MRKKGESNVKQTEARKGVLLPVVLGTGVSLGLVLLLVLGIACLVWSGTLPAATPSVALSVCMGACAFIGGRFAIGRGKEPILVGTLTGVLLAVLMAMVCLGMSGSVPFHGRFLATILLILAGGALSGLFGGKKKRPKKKKK